MKIFWIISLFCLAAHSAIVVRTPRSFDLQTTDATQTALSSDTLPDNVTWIVKVRCQAKKTDNTKRSSFKKTVTVYRAGGIATLDGSTSIEHEQAGGPYGFAFGVSGNDIQYLGTGLAAENVQWDCNREVEIIV